MAVVNIAIVLALCWLVVVEASPEEDSLKEHNRLRKKHGCPPLTLDDTLTKDCEEYAKVIGEQGSLTHSGDGRKYGENLCYRSDDPLKCVQDWYDEIKDYDFDKGQYSSGIGHFTAMIWKSAQKMGYGQVKNDKGVYFVVARYYPPVNIIGQFKENVPKPIDDGTTMFDNSSMVQVNALLILLAFLHFTN
ncbi:Golgi-associated plant pathogenesis-related protein 1 isoform X2 [Drosophila rhopaloa]|uniref:Golgi-associated plant pathogenesis-related protein 1 isoform X2 n=1 Tax=Drosophila rhopaloa TaxID=1041015 RepID=A0A6P4EAA2_DRORH|nr:Golgi-associated plant pathogenesis-related protein 1 isoform X2 [Drosophila rhopaloa]